MDQKRMERAENPRAGANILSIITFGWLFKIFSTGYRQEITKKDLYSPLKEHSSHYLGEEVLQLWDGEAIKCKHLPKKSKPSLLKVLIGYFGNDFLLFGICLAMVEFAVKTTQPIILAHLLRYFGNQCATNRSIAMYWGSLLMLGLLIDCIVSYHVFHGLTHMGMKLRVACSSLIYKKILRISKVAADDKMCSGQIMNLLTNDVNRLDYAVFMIHYIWIAPLQTIVVSYFLYQELGLAPLVGVLTLIMFIPIHGCYGQLVSKFTKEYTHKTDERLRLTDEIMRGITVIKMYAWEKWFQNIVDKARRTEVKSIRNSLVSTELIWSLEKYIPRLGIFMTILVYIMSGNDIDAAKAFLITAFFNVLRSSLYRTLSLSVREMTEGLVSIRRIQNFLTCGEVQSTSMIEQNRLTTDNQNSFALSVKNVSIKRNSDSEILKDLSFSVESGSLTAIVGQVGSGKTTLLYAVLQEILPATGVIKINGKVSYASQEPWLFAASVRQNILFGQPMNKKRYEKVIEVCQLKQDFQLLPYGDKTLVCEKGLNLSGGQCARINLARAVYHEADIYLLDDPLSAVDIRVGRGIFVDCVKRFLSNKTVILVTHQLQLLKDVDKLIILNDGSVQAEGTYEELSGCDSNLMRMVEPENEPGVRAQNIQTSFRKKLDRLKSFESIIDEGEFKEATKQGSVSFKTYKQYFAGAKSTCLIVLVMVMSVICQVPATAADYFLTYWVNSDTHISDPSPDDLLRGHSWFIYVYAALILLTIIVTTTHISALLGMCMRISKNLHSSMFKSVIHSKMLFFNANPVGRLMNRFSKDIGVIDTQLPLTIIDVSQIFLYTFFVIGLLIFMSPWFSIPITINFVIAYFLRQFYIRTCRSLKRLEGISRSPVLNHANATLCGLPTIRAIGNRTLLTTEFNNHQDLHSAAWYIHLSGSRAFGMYIELLWILSTSIAVFFLLSVEGSMSPGNAGLIITQCIMLSRMLQWGVRQSTELENQVISVERIMEYSDLPGEQDFTRASSERKPEGWPHSGRIVFEDVSLIYSPQGKPALRNLNFVIEPNQRIGIVGRTGAGKSSIISALFRLADTTGEIYIDDVATSRVTLEDLRSSISIIPQEPVLFAGTLRRNLDPLDEYSDEELWQALEEVELKGSFESDLGLNTKVMECGINFSVGQRQLLCLARAIVRNNRILVLDEPTANVDLCTDELIQKVVKRKSSSCTILIIAHRLKTVMDCNQILLMDSGRVVELDHPYKLLQQENGLFRKMVEQTGPCMAEKLFKMAELSYEYQDDSSTSKPHNSKTHL